MSCKRARYGVSSRTIGISRCLKVFRHFGSLYASVYATTLPLACFLCFCVLQSVSDADGDFRRTVIMVAHSCIKPRLLHGGSWQNCTPISSLALVSSIILRKHRCIRKRSSAGRMAEWSAGRFRIVGDRVACYFETLAMSLDADRSA